MRKLQGPSSKLPRSPKFQAPTPAVTAPSKSGFGAGCFSGAWSLELGIFAMVLLSGCAVGPNYRRPSVDSPATFRGDNAPTNRSFADLDWWDIYQDTNLRALIREAFINNYDLRIALARVQQARALAMQARSQ